MNRKKGDAINKPIDAWNHCWDAGRYYAVERLSRNRQGGSVIAFGGR